jgi:hypothetical protein
VKFSRAGVLLEQMLFGLKWIMIITDEGEFRIRKYFIAKCVDPTPGPAEVRQIMKKISFFLLLT